MEGGLEGRVSWLKAIRALSLHVKSQGTAKVRAHIPAVNPCGTRCPLCLRGRALGFNDFAAAQAGRANADALALSRDFRVHRA